MKYITLIFSTALALSCSHPAADLPKLFPVPNASLIADSGKPIQLDAMKGSVTVYDFIFTHCTASCPMMTANMSRITKAIDRDAPVRFVSISVDPQHDTPAVLREYAARVRSDPRWMFLTGNGGTIIDISEKGFKLAAVAAVPSGAEPLLHSTKFVIADKQGIIRAYCDGTASDAVDQVAGTVRDLLRE